MIDLHTHILFGLDDGPDGIEGSLAIAREAAAQGVTAIAGTPHVRDDYPTPARSMLAAVAAVRSAVAEEGIPIDVLPGAEIAYDRLDRLDDEELRLLTLGGSPNHLLIELPFFGWPLDAKAHVRRLREAGFIAVMAHPERNSAVQDSPRPLEELVRAGALVQITASSLVGGFGPGPERAAKTLLAAGLVHLAASDIHRAGGRRSALAPALETLRNPALGRWLTVDVPTAILRGAPCPPRPQARARWGARGLLRRSR